MSHMVIFRSAEGRPGYHQADELHDAAAFVERMRNEEGVEHARIFRMEEVTFEFRPYYRVSLGAEAAPAAVPTEPAGAEAAAAALTAEPEQAATPVVEPTPVPVPSMIEPEPMAAVPLGGNGAAAGRRGLFGR